MSATRLALPLIIVAAMSMPATAVGLGDASAWPYKSSRDSGRYSVAQDNAGYDVFNAKFGTYAQVDGYDPCVYDFQSLTPPTVQPNTIQQYAVPGCVPVISPWIANKPWQTRNWDLYCPTSAPWSYDYVYFDDQAILESSFQDISNWGPSERLGPSPVGRTNTYSTNWALKTHHWAWSASCSATEPLYSYTDESKVADQKYSGATGGPSASKISPSNAPAGGGAQAASRPTAVAATRGPLLRNERVDARTLHRTAEHDLAPGAVRRYRLTCPTGYAPTRPRHGVGWYTDAPPSAVMSDRVDDVAVSAPGGRGIEVRVTTGAIPARIVRLQMAVDCIASGDATASFTLSAAQLLINQRIGQAAIRRLAAVEATLDGRPAPAATRAPGGSQVRLSTRQLLINQRIYQAGVRRANALQARLDGTPAPLEPSSGRPGDISLSVVQLRINQRVAQAAVRRANALAAHAG